MPDDEPAENGSEGDEIDQAGDEPFVGVGRIDSDALSQAAESGQVGTSVDAQIDEDGNPIIERRWETRTAAFAELVDKPKQKAISDDRTKGTVEFNDSLRKFDPELAGTIRAQSQSAASGLSVTHPAVEGERSDMSDLEKRLTTECHDLVDELNIKKDSTTFFRNAIVHGNDVSHIEYEEDKGVVNITPLPLRLLTIVDDATKESGYNRPKTRYVSQSTDYDAIVDEADWYVISEDNEDARGEFPAHDVLHIARNRRGNWHEDRVGRLTYNIWGEGGLEPVKYAVQTKQNTMSNKVAMDDKLLTREYYHINVEELFGHIEDPDQRQREVEDYASDLRTKLENLNADQKPILPEEVSVEVRGPDGQTARNQAEFIQTMNDSIQHALTYHVASFGRDAGGTDRGNRPAKEMSDNSVRQLRDVVKTAFRELFRIHCILVDEDAREVANPEYGEDDIRRYELADDIVLPTLTFDPVDPEDRNDEIRNAATLYEKGIADLNEARAEANLPPIDEKDRDERLWHPEKNPTTFEEDKEMQEPESSPDDTNGSPENEETDGERESPNEEPTESRPSMRTNSSEGERVERTERVGEPEGGDET